MTRAGKCEIKSHNYNDFQMICPLCQRQFKMTTKKSLHKVISYHMKCNHPEIQFEFGPTNPRILTPHDKDYYN